MWCAHTGVQGACAADGWLAEGRVGARLLVLEDLLDVGLQHGEQEIVGRRRVEQLQDAEGQLEALREQLNDAIDEVRCELCDELDEEEAEAQ